ncbi:deoxyribose-phosphate aldolase [Gaetbulibacter aestuarii]|uniref:Deoxyribose-phosphate aldolase n=1 Tax=Gaetbulibacter aestuarii TaxID=1502358 RepID=A0ABW7N174_9FLAO
MNIYQHIDFTLLEPTTTESEIIDLCVEAKNFGFNSICINSCYVSIAKKLLKFTDVKVSTVIGYPLGAMATASKVYEAQKALEDGADEINMVINLGYLKSEKYISMLQDISKVKQAIGTTPLVVIIEISELNKNEIIKACELCLESKVDFIKTSTGFSKNGATLTAVKMIKKTLKDQAKIIASGGIEDFETAIKYVEVGADRVASSYISGLKKKSQQLRNKAIFEKYMENKKNNDLISEPQGQIAYRKESR